MSCRTYYLRNTLECFFLIFAIGGLFIGLGLILGSVTESEIRIAVERSVVISGPEDEDYKGFLNTQPDDTPTYRDFYAFNLTNMQQVLQGEKPVYEEIGPYSYRKWIDRKNVTFPEGAATATYADFTYYTFDRERTPSALNPETDSITNIDFSYVGVVNIAGGDQALLAGVAAGAIGQFQELMTGLFAGFVVDQGFTTTIESSRDQLVAAFMITNDIFLSEWANATTNLANQSSWAAFRISSVNSSGISLESAQNLWNASMPLSILDSPTWLAAEQGDPTAIGGIQQTFGLTTEQLDLVIAWRKNFKTTLIVPGILSTFSLTDVQDIGYLQWATGAVFPSGVKSIIPTLDGAVEIALWSQSNFTLSVTQAKSILSSTAPGLAVPESFGLFLGLVAANQFETIQNTWGLSPQEAGTVALYLSYVIETFGKTAVLNTFSEGSGLFVTRTIEEMFWTGQDPLLALLGEDPDVALQGNNTLDPATSTFYTGNTARDLSGVILEYFESPTWDNWAEPVPIRGFDSKIYPVGIKKEERYPTFVSDIQRTVDIVYQKTVDLHGVSLYRYVLSDEDLAVNTLYYQGYKGLANMTSTQRGVPLFLCQPHFLAADELWTSRVDGLSPNQEDHQIFVDIEPDVGATFRGAKRLQINMHVPEGTTLYSTLHPNVTTGVMYPVFWLGEVTELSEEDTKSFNQRVILARDSGTGAGYALIALGGLIIIVDIIVYLIVRFKN